MNRCGIRFLLLILGTNPALMMASPEPMAQGLSGNYKLSYIASDLRAIYRSDKDKRPVKESFDYKEVATPPALAPIYMLHDPKGPSATLVGAGSESPRLCEGENQMLSQEMECTPLSKRDWVDEATRCGIQSLFVEGITWSLLDNLRYSRTEALIFDKATPKECVDFKKSMLAQLEKNEAPDFFKAMKAAGLFTSENDFADAFLLSHVYQAAETKEKAMQPSEGDHSGEYDLEYSGVSKSASWTGGNDKKEKLSESKPFNAKDESLYVRPEETILIFHNPANEKVKVVTGNENKLRNCAILTDDELKTETFSCNLFKANEEEVGTGCTIEHWIKEEITFSPDASPRYSHIEQRHFSSSTPEGCDNYRQKISNELKEGSAELFFRTLLKTGGIDSPEQLGDTFQVVHEYKMKAH